MRFPADPSQDAVDLPRLRRTLGAPALSGLVDRLVQRIRLGRPLSGSLTLSGISDAERRALRGLLGSRYGGASVTINLDALAETLRAAGIAPDLESALQSLAGPIVSRADLQAAEAEARSLALAVLDGCVHAGEPWFADWVVQLSAGPLTRLLRSDAAELIAQAVAVLDRLPGVSLPLSVLAERATGDTKSLASEEPLSRLVLRALALRAGTAPPVGSEARRALWASAGVIVDDLASQVLLLNVRAHPGATVPDWLNDAADLGIPFRLTLQQLRLQPVVPVVPEIFVCENPAVLRAATAELGRGCAPLVCTEGVPSAACHALLEAAATAGARLRWRADFDWAGLRITGAALTRHGAVPWRMGSEDYAAALEAGASEPLRGTPADSSWDPALAPLLAETGQAVMEERLIPHLLADLR
ncbi:TIGR02679 family protein [Actinomadura alba]|uniref:TIGR02679 family protein n=1 Tax=Actinomadura alba TaxID=406431 RepID=A0ABR7LQH9_9ACTN|nr:TIGR02679 family protein [Actinomadura alba]MBC6466735.1 TIGR02679 family protein [Actinomadura alba]